MRKSKEHSIQAQLIARLRWFHPELNDLVMAIPNGAPVTARQRMYLSAEGMLAGAPDLLIAKPVAPYHGLFLELKTEKGVLSEAQKRVQRSLESVGYRVITVYGFEAAYDAVCAYMEAK